MDVLYSHCCGLDIHKKKIVACAITPEGKHMRTFGTMTEQLHELAEWIINLKCTHVAMESTGSYWKPIINVLELTDLTVLVVNASHIKALAGRKTDMKDAEWIATLLRHGLLKGSFIPNRQQREDRELARFRESLVGERTRAVNRLQKVLEGGNIKLSSVASNVVGKSCRAVLNALIHGAKDPEKLALLTEGRLQAPIDEIKQALNGAVGPHQLLMLDTLLRQIDFLNCEIQKLNEEMAKRLAPFEEDLVRLDTIPGVGRHTAELIITEGGADMSIFPSDAHYVSWAGFAPGQHESAGKSKKVRTRKGSKRLRSGLVRAARSAARKKNCYLSSCYNRLCGRMDKNKAAMAIARKIMIAAYHILKDKVPYRELGPDYYDEQMKERYLKQSIKRLESLGYKVSIEKSA